MLTRINRNMTEKDKGFTLIELLVVIIIIGILSAIAIPLFLNQQKKAQDAAARADVSTIGKEVATWYVDTDTAPTLAQDTTANTYTIDGESIGNSSSNVVLTTPTTVGDSLTWCVEVTNAKGDKSVDGVSYSAANGLQDATC